MFELVLDVFLQTLEVTAVVFLMMVLVDFFDVRFREKIQSIMHNSAMGEHISTSLLGILPGCAGSYVNVSLYMHGIVSIGAIAAGMIATSGDEAFVMLAEFPLQAILLFGILFLISVPAGMFFNYLVRKFNYTQRNKCQLAEIHPQDKAHNLNHYIQVHIYQHIVKRHLPRVFLWTFFSFLLIKIGFQYFDIQSFVSNHMGWLLFAAALIGILPESGPHLIFISLFAQGAAPFSILLASSIAQDGHGMLPLLSYSLKDSLWIKLYNVLLALVIGGAAYWAGF